MSSIKYFLNIAAEYALKEDNRSFWIGALGVRSDGAIVKSRNGSNYSISPELHAEFRLSKKLDVGAEVYVARLRRDTLEWSTARPCRMCRHILKSKGVKFVYYTISPGEYGVLDLDLFQEKSKPTGIKLDRFSEGRWRRGPS